MLKLFIPVARKLCPGSCYAKKSLLYAKVFLFTVAVKFNVSYTLCLERDVTLIATIDTGRSMFK
jgi:hypothetical protein